MSYGWIGLVVSRASFLVFRVSWRGAAAAGVPLSGIKTRPRPTNAVRRVLRKQSSPGLVSPHKRRARSLVLARDEYDAQSVRGSASTASGLPGSAASLSQRPAAPGKGIDTSL